MTTFSEQFPIVFQALNVGFVQTLKLFFITLIGAIPLGLIISFGSMSAWRPFRVFRSVKWLSEFKPVRAITRLVIWVVRGTPLMLQLIAVFYVPGLGVPRGQQEAGQVLGMTKSQIFFQVTLLQMVKKIVPPMSNEIITLVKDTSLSRIIALQEVIWAGQAFMKGSQGISGAIWPLFFTGVYYLIFSGILTLLLGWAERKLDYFKA